MAARRRTLAAFAAGALLVPLSPFASPAFAGHVDVRSIEGACPTNELPPDPFTDVDDDDDFNDEITCIAEYDVTRGTTATTYDPSAFVIRSQMALFISRILVEAGVDLDASSAGFTDLGPLDQGTRDAINGLANAGVVNGTTATTFGPGENIRRDQMASFIANAQLEGLDRAVSTREDFFTDDDDNVHESKINLIAFEGITVGAGGGDRLYGADVFVNRRQMAAFLARKLDILVEEGFVENRFEGPPAAVAIDDESVEAGDPVTGTISGQNVESATVTGDCVTEGTVDDTDPATDDIDFSVDTDAAAATGDCELTFTVAFESGRSQDLTSTVTIVRPSSPPPPPTGPSQPSGGTTNARPELIGASIESTTTPGQVVPGRPAGTVVSYTFDEAILTSGNPPRVTSFFVYDKNGVADNSGQIVEVSGNVVRIRYSQIDDPAEFGALTLATVDLSAVTDVSGAVNPEGDAPLGGSSGGGTTTLPAGLTSAPDLDAVGPFRTAATAGQTAVDFRFDVAAFVNDPRGFALVLLADPDGSAAEDNELRCVGPDPTTPASGSGSTPGAGTRPGGNGTTTVTVVCPRVVTAGDVARGTVDENTVATTQQDADAGTDPVAGTGNPLQAAEVSSGGNTPSEPDLDSVELRPSVDGSNGGVDAALFTFDQPVTQALGERFFLYTTSGLERVGRNAVVNSRGDARQVLVEFVGGTQSVVGANVRDGAVVAGISSVNTNEDANEQDELGISNTASNGPAQVPGRTTDPDLVGVAITRGASDDFGNPGPFQATYTFDEDVAGPTPGGFRLFLADGTQLNGVTCTVGGTEDTDGTVTCTAYTNTGPDPDRGATLAEIGSAVLGTVDDGAVRDQAMGLETNPQGGEPTTGGTGTRTS